MQRIKVALCPDCDHCSSVEITDEYVRIGEDDKIVELSHGEWNELVRLIRGGQLGST